MAPPMTIAGNFTQPMTIAEISFSFIFVISSQFFFSAALCYFATSAFPFFVRSRGIRFY